MRVSMWRRGVRWGLGRRTCFDRGSLRYVLDDLEVSITALLGNESEINKIPNDMSQEFTKQRTSREQRPA